MTNHRLTFAAAIAVLAASLSLGSLLVGTSWLVASIGSVAAVALAATLTRLPTLQAAIAATVAVLVAVVPVLAGYGGPGIAGALAVLGLTAASATGARLLRVFAGCATYIAVPFLYINAVFAGPASWASVIPSSRSLSALASLPGHASSDFNYAPPVPTTRPVEFITVCGVTVIAICVDVIAVRLRRPALAGLPLLLLFSVPVASSLKSFGIVQTLLFGLAVAAYLALLSADGRQRLRMWGRLVTIRRAHPGDDTTQGPDTRQIAASGRRVGLTAVALAMVVPVFLAGTPPKDLFAKSSTGGGGGLAIPGGPSPLDNVGAELLLTKPTLVLTYVTDNPLPQDQYLQEYVLNFDYKDDGRWVPSATTGRHVTDQRLPYQGVPGVTDLVPVTTVHTSVSLERTLNSPLPLPYAPVQLDTADTGLTETAGSLMVFGADPEHSSFSVVSKEAEPSAGDLEITGAYPQALEKTFTAYRGPDAHQLLAIARRVAGSAATPLDKAVALQHWFTSGRFTYTLHEKWPGSGSWLLRFLTSDRRGDCEQFAPAFAVLARLLGIPARVAVGFTGGTPAGKNSWKVTTADAHAWPELYFPGAGWIRFEPTPAGGEGEAGQGTATTPGYTIAPPKTGTGSQGTTPGSSPSTGTAGHQSPNKNGQKAIQDTTAGAGAGGAHGSGFPLWILVLAAVLLLLASPALARWLTQRRRWLAASTDPARAHVAWREFRDYLIDYGITTVPSESPRALARRVASEARLDPAAVAAVTRLGAAEERARYSQAPLAGGALRADVATVRRALAARATRRQRVVAWCLPPSTTRSAINGLQSSGRALTWLDAPLPSWRSGRTRRQPQQAR